MWRQPAGALSNRHPPAPPGRPGAALAGAGILLSRLSGLVRERVFAHFFGNLAAADAFKAAFRIPNLLQNLFGEGVLSASFIPVYIGLLAQGDEEEARRLAGAVLGLLVLLSAVATVIGVAAAPWLIDLIAAGFRGSTRALSIRLVRIFFPGAGLLVISAWCLGVLNSHRRFFLSYAAPVVWNGAIIAALVGFGGRYGRFELAEWVALGAVVGSLLQVGIQWPAVRRLLGAVRMSFDHRGQHVREVVRNAVPVFAGRGVIQISSYVDAWLASWLPTGAMATLSYAQTLYLLPISLFGMAVSAAELPAMSGVAGGVLAEAEMAAALRRRLTAGLRQIAFFVLPSAVAFLALGDVVVAAIYRTGAFGRGDVLYVWGTLAGATVGLLASALGRLYSSTYYALRDTRTPLRYAMVRVGLTTVLGVVAAFWLPGWLGIPSKWGVAGLTLAAAIAAWTEFSLLRRGLRRRLRAANLPKLYLAEIGGAAVLAALAARALLMRLPHWTPWPTAVVVLGLYGGVYFGIAWLLRLPELRALRRLLRLS